MTEIAETAPPAASEALAPAAAEPAAPPAPKKETTLESLDARLTAAEHALASLAAPMVGEFHDDSSLLKRWFADFKHLFGGS